MDITITRTGRTFYEVDSSTAALFCEAGLAVQAAKVAPAKPQAAPEFFVANLESGTPAIGFRNLLGTQFYTGDADRAADYKFNGRWAAPAEVVAQYQQLAAAKKAEDSFGPNERLALENAQRAAGRP